MSESENTAIATNATTEDVNRSIANLNFTKTDAKPGKNAMNAEETIAASLTSFIQIRSGANKN